jgi:hypothetical protein
MNRKEIEKTIKRDMQWLDNRQQIDAVKMAFKIWAGAEA